MNKQASARTRTANQPYMFKFRNDAADTGTEHIHSHLNMEIMLVHEGTGQLIIDQKEYPVCSGMLILFQPLQLHKVRKELQAGQQYIESYLLFDAQFFDRHLALLPAFQSFFNTIWRGNLKRQVFYLAPERFAEFEKRFESFHLNGQSLPTEEQLVLFLFSLVSGIRGLFAEEEKTETIMFNQRSQHLVERITAWIEQHYQDEFSLDRMAGSLHVSPYYASHLFSEEMGCTISHYVMNRRLQEACLLLKTTNLPVSLIGQKVGFNSSAYFGKCFKDKFGTSPQAYRKNIVGMYGDYLAQQSGNPVTYSFCKKLKSSTFHSD